MVMPALLLQKPNPKSKAKDHAQHLERRLRHWAEVDLESLIKEGQTIQQQFIREHQGRPDQQTSRLFAKLMIEGKVRAALRLIQEDGSSGPLGLDSQLESNNPTASSETVREALQKKHPPPQQLQQTSIITPEEETTEPDPILFERIDGQLICNTALRMDGAAGPSGLDAAAFKRLCTSFKSESTELCDALASTARRISSSFVDPNGLSAFVACQLIALDKRPGIRPIGVGETSRRIIGKAIATAWHHR